MCNCYKKGLGYCCCSFWKDAMQNSFIDEFLPPYKMPLQPDAKPITDNLGKIFNPMQTKPKVGDKFNLGGFVWQVTDIDNSSGFYASRVIDNRLKTSEGEYFSHDEICRLDWIKPEVKKLTKEQAEKVKNYFTAWQLSPALDHSDMMEYIDSIME